MKSGGKVFFMLLAVQLLASCAVLSPERRPGYFAGSIESVIPDGYSPRGSLTEVRYNTSVPGPSSRRMMVYLPEEYDSCSKRYPVVYLLHGARGYETSWIVKGNILQITDSLVSEGTAEPFILVMPNMNQYRNDSDMKDSRRKNALESLFEIDGTVESAFMDDVVNTVDSLFRTIPDKSHRAIGGLSIGGLQSLYISANNPNSFDYIGLFSPLSRIIRKPGGYTHFYKSAKSKLETQFADAPELYLVMIGRKDIFLQHIRKFHRYLERHGYAHSFIVTTGGHDWPYWKQDCIHFLTGTFR